MVYKEEDREINISRRYCVHMTGRKGCYLQKEGNQDGELVWSEGGGEVCSALEINRESLFSSPGRA